MRLPSLLHFQELLKEIDTFQSKLERVQVRAGAGVGADMRHKNSPRCAISCHQMWSVISGHCSSSHDVGCGS